MSAHSDSAASNQTFLRSPSLSTMSQDLRTGKAIRNSLGGHCHSEGRVWVVSSCRGGSAHRTPWGSPLLPCIRPSQADHTAEPSPTACLQSRAQLHVVWSLPPTQLVLMSDSLNPIYKELLEQGFPPEGWGSLDTGLESQVTFPGVLKFLLTSVYKKPDETMILKIAFKFYVVVTGLIKCFSWQSDHDKMKINLL